ncbi:MAG: alkaline phosphatase family protein [Ignavibacteriae bacterium]|nr:alkaline phosphatase family protein [Ignavibacteriota bacterium]
MKIILLFLDGVGIGKPDPAINPIFQAKLPELQSLLGVELFSLRRKRISTQLAELSPANATLGVEGLPQSGTGQTAIFTGVNAPKLIKKHFGPYPPTALRQTIYEKNIFRQLKAQEKSVCFANAFPKKFFEYTESGTRRLTVTTLSCMMSNTPLLTADILKANKAVSADFVRERWAELGHPDIEPITSREAGKHLAEIASRHDFTLFEYWLTDHAGHSREMSKAVNVLERFDEFLGGLIETVDLDTTLIAMISDHGNIEDLSTKSHTRNPVPCIAIGKARKEFVKRVKNLTHVTPAILEILG